MQTATAGENFLKIQLKFQQEPWYLQERQQ